MSKEKGFKSIFFIILSLLGLLAAGLLVRRTLELRREAAYGSVSLSVLPSPVEVCYDQLGVSNLYLKLNPNSFNVGAAELTFAFDPDLVNIESVNFHSAYGASIFRVVGNELKITVLSMGDVPSAVFDLAVIGLRFKAEGSFNFDLTSYNIKGTRGSIDPDLDRDLTLSPDSVLAQVNVVSTCGAATPTSAGPTATRAPTPTSIPGVGATVRVSPSTQSINTGAQTNITIEVSNISNMYGFQLDLGYDEATLDYVGWAKGTFMTQADDANQPFWVNPQVSNGLLKGFAVTRLNPDPSISGSGSLFTVTFSGHSGGTSAINIENAIFSNMNGNNIPVNVVGGQIVVSGGVITPQPTTRPTATRAPTTRPTATRIPTGWPTTEPTGEPTTRPTATRVPTTKPTTTRIPTTWPTGEPTVAPTTRPTATRVPTTRPTATRTPTGWPTTEPTITPTPWPTTWPTPIPSGQPTPTGIAYGAKINFTVKLVGTSYKVGDTPIVVQDIGQIPVKVAVRTGDYWEMFDNVIVTFDNEAVGRGSVEIKGASPGTAYSILIKGPVHLAKKFCEDNQTGHCWIGQENITIHPGENNFNWIGAELEPGDLNADGVVDSVDFALLKRAIGQQGRVLEDINYNGQVDTQDLVFFLETLSRRYEDEI